MTQSKHTPGPWKVAPNGSVVTADHSQTITSSIENKANARIIAAVPEMLDALEIMVKTFGNSTVLSDYGRDKVAQARAAIAKAKGQA